MAPISDINFSVVKTVARADQSCSDEWMKTDLYTKIVLTVIAGCLVAMLLNNVRFIPEARAASNETLKVEVVNRSPILIKSDETLKVRVER